MSKIKVIAAVVDTVQLTLYLQDGSTTTIQQGDPRVKPIVDSITPILMAGGVADVDLHLGKETNFAEFEEKAGGLVKFFRVAKKKLSNWLQNTELLQQKMDEAKVASQVLGNVLGTKAPAEVVDTAEEPSEEEQLQADIDANTQAARHQLATAISKIPKEKTPEEKMKDATDEIMQHAVPVKSHHFADHQVREDQEDHALVAVVGEKVIPNVQNLHAQIKHANTTGKSKGLVAFLERAAKIPRSHSVDDLMKFAQKGDLPFADDGCLVIYKRLLGHKTEKGDYVDVHSKNVHQRVGDYVCMAESLVDPNRNNECSNGLHVARRQYLKGFSGDKMILAKVRPEDVIAVPRYDPNKMRVCGYHIIAEVSNKDAARLIADMPIREEDEAARVLASIMAGHHAPPSRKVEICGPNGANLRFTDLETKKEELVTNSINLPPVAAIKETTLTAPEDRTDGELVDVHKLAAEVAPTPAPTAPKAPESRQETAARLFKVINEGTTAIERLEAAQELTTLRKGWKIGWGSLGLNERDVQRIDRALAKDPSAPKPVAPPAPKKQATKPVAPPPVKAEAKAAPLPPDGPKARIAGKLPAALNGSKPATEEIFLIKRTAKKSWDLLGIDAVTLRKLELVLKK